MKSPWNQCKPTTIRQSLVSSGASSKVYMVSSASQQRYVNLLSPAEPPTKSPWHHWSANNATSASIHQRSIQQSLHGIIGQPTMLRQSPFTSGASDAVPTASFANQQQCLNLPSLAEPPTKSPRHHRPANNNTSISRHQRSLRQSLHGIIGALGEVYMASSASQSPVTSGALD